MLISDCRNLIEGIALGDFKTIVFNGASLALYGIVIEAGSLVA